MDSDREELRRTHENAKTCVEAMMDTLFAVSEMLGKHHYLSANLQVPQLTRDCAELCEHIEVLSKWEGKECLSNR